MFLSVPHQALQPGAEKMMYEHETKMEIMGLDHPMLVLYTTERDLDGQPVLTIEEIHVAGHEALLHFDKDGRYLGTYPESVDILPILTEWQVEKIKDEIECRIREDNDAAMAAELY